MTTASMITAPAVRSRQCPLCETPARYPCQDKPSGDHLARYLDAYTAGHLTRACMAAVLGELVVIDGCAVVEHEPEPPRCTARHLLTGYQCMRVVPPHDGYRHIAGDGSQWDDEDAQPSSLVGRLVERDYDDSPCPVVGLVVGQVDEDTLEVLWGERRFEENPGTGTYEPFDALRPARDGAR